MVALVLLIESSCQIQGMQSPKEPDKTPSKQVTEDLPHRQSSADFFEEKKIHPLPLNYEEFSTVSEWLDNENILYIDRENERENIYCFNIYTGKRELFYTTDKQIVTVSASYDHQYFLVRTAPSTYEAELIILDKWGKEVFRWKVGSFDLLATWNPFVKSQLYVTTFLQDWSFQTYFINVSQKTVMESHLPIPFIQWVDRTEIAYLKWNENEPAFQAPLYRVNLVSKKEEKVFDDISFFSVFKDTVMTVTVENEPDAIYSFYNLEMKNKLGEFKVPVLAKYSEWFIPEFDYVESEKRFYTFRPTTSGNYDQYNQKYDLLAYSHKNSQEKIVMKDIENKPIKFSPNGKLCLYGYYFENIIQIKDKKIVPLIQIDEQ